MFHSKACGDVTKNFLLRRARKLAVGWAETGGRAASGRTTSFKKGAYRFKRLYRFIDFWRRLREDAFVISFERDAFRSSTIALVFYQTGYVSYISLPDGYIVGDKLSFSSSSVVDGGVAISCFPGNALPLKHIPEGSHVFNVEMWPLKGAQLCRAAGAHAVLLTKRNNFVTLKMRSGWKFVLSAECYATVGISSNYKHAYNVIRKAGTAVNSGRRPTVRGVAMNAIDHPHGGGRGKTSGGPRSRTPWGALTKQHKTVSRNRRLSMSSVRFR